MIPENYPVVLVTPVWNDSKRLGVFGPHLADAIAASGLPIRWIVADDGSCAEEVEKTRGLISKFQKQNAVVEGLFLEKRSRKGGAIYQAWILCPDADWLAFVDADGAIDATSTIRLIEKARELGKQGGCIAIRKNMAEAPVRRKWHRVISFRLFTALVRWMVRIPFSDTQCGGKVIPGSAFRQVAPKLEERGFVFDVELLLALSQTDSQIHEMPVPWEEIGGSKVNMLQDAWNMIRRLQRIRKRMKAGHYVV